MLNYHGHTFDSSYCSCCVGDERKIIVDPTNTGLLRRKFRSSMGHRWNQLRILVREMVTKQDLLGLKSGGLMQVAAPAILNAGTKLDVFQRWLDLALQRAVLGVDGSWMRPFLVEAYAAGTRFGQEQAATTLLNANAAHRENALIVLARVELEGVVEAVSQGAVRFVANGLMTGAKPMAIVRGVQAIIETVGRRRSDAMIELLVVRAHSEASLDVYETAGLRAVGLLPESRAQSKVVTDATGKQKKASSAKTAKGGGPGSRTKRSRPPSQRTIQRIRRAELNTARRLGENINVRTAGDDSVCPVCEAISEDGPYPINTARGLIPAHPRCRCVFVPANDARFASDIRADGSYRANEFEAGQVSRGSLSSDTGGGNPNHDPENGQFSSGGGTDLEPGDPVGKDIPADPDYAYHGTNQENFREIAATGGLKTFGPSHGTDQSSWPDGSTEKRSYWTGTPKTADHFYPEHGRPVLLRARRSSVNMRTESTGDLYTKKPVSATKLEYYSATGNWLPLKGK